MKKLVAVKVVAMYIAGSCWCTAALFYDVSKVILYVSCTVMVIL